MPELDSFDCGESRQNDECAGGDRYSKSVAPYVLSETI
jgi:hypothetical protein